MLPYLARRIANYAVLLFIATSLAYLLASASLDPSALWNRQDPSLNWDAIHANLVKYNISHDLPVWDRYVTWLRNVLFHWDWGRTPKGELINTLIGTKIFVSVRLVFLGAAIGMVGGVALGAWTDTRQYRFSDRVTSLISMIIISTPAMVIAILLQVLAVQINRSSGFQIFEFTGAAITERVYGWHGMGEYSISAISGMDINGVTAVVAFSGLCTLTGALLSDVFVAIVDPRVRVS